MMALTHTVPYRVLSRLWRHGFLGMGSPFVTFAPPGHFYSPIPHPALLRQRKDLFDRHARTIPGIAVNEAAQLALLADFASVYGDMPPFTPHQSAAYRYYFENAFFSYGDAIALYSMLRRFRPRRIIEVGSGFSSAAMLDIQDRYSMDLSLTCIEPDAARLRTLLWPGDAVDLIPSLVQDVPLTRFDALEANDVLFIDSSHVVKIGSDVGHLLTHVLPRLRPGVLVHIHDVFWPFEYPEHWLRDGRAWNEAYAVKAFLQFNAGFEIVFFNSYLATHHWRALETHVPLALRNPGGSLWIRRLSDITDTQGGTNGSR